MLDIPSCWKTHIRSLPARTWPKPSPNWWNGPLSKPLVKAFEPSQPIWHYGVNKAGYENTFQVLYDDHKSFHLYRLANLYNDVISKPAVLFRDLRPLASGSADEVVTAIEKWIGTEKE